MTPEVLESVLNVADLLAAAGIVTWMLVKYRRGRELLTLSFFSFAMVSLLLTNAYWLAHSLLRPDMRMPLSANTIGECAVFLLLAAAVNSMFPDRRFSFSPQIIGILLFILVSIALWIAWSGEWLQDLLGGAAFGYLLYVCARGLCHTNAFSKKEWIALAALCGGWLGAFSIWTFYENRILETAGYLLMFATILLFLYKTVCSIYHRDGAEKQIVLSVSSYACCMSGVYMAEEYWYIAAEMLCLLTLFLMTAAFGKEAEQA